MMTTRTLASRIRWAVALLPFVLAPSLAHAQSGVVEYYHLDAVGSVRAVTAEDGSLLRLHDFKPFGEEITPPSTADRKLFTGQERDHQTGLDYVGARYYRPDLGRFTTVDPGHVNGDVGDTQSWSPYASVRNNPLRFADPSGTHYFIDVESGADFWALTDIFSELIVWASPYRMVGGPNGGDIQDSAGMKLGTYQFYDLFEYTVWQAGHMAQPAVDLAEAALGTVRIAASFWAPTALVAAGFDCIVEGRCGARGVMMAGLSPAALRKLGGLASLSGRTVAQVIRLRGGGGSQIHAVPTALQYLTLGEVAERAVAGDRAADKAIHIVKGAKRLHEKY